MARGMLLLGLPAAILAVLLALPWETAVTYQDSFVRNTTATPTSQPLDTPEYSRIVTHFDSHGTRVEAWLYTPKSAEGHAAAGHRFPVVIMAHGRCGVIRACALVACMHMCAHGTWLVG